VEILRHGAHSSLLVVCLALIVTSVGCGAGDPCWLKGTVKFDGELLPDGDVRLDPIGNPEAARAAAHIDNGQFEIPREAGMLAGTYRVAIYAVRETGKRVVTREALHGGKITKVEEEEQYIPEQFNRRSKLRVDLAPGENEREFALVP